MSDGTRMLAIDAQRRDAFAHAHKVMAAADHGHSHPHARGGDGRKQTRGLAVPTICDEALHLLTAGRKKGRGKRPITVGDIGGSNDLPPPPAEDEEEGVGPNVQESDHALAEKAQEYESKKFANPAAAGPGSDADISSILACASRRLSTKRGMAWWSDGPAIPQAGTAIMRFICGDPHLREGQRIARSGTMTLSDAYFHLHARGFEVYWVSANDSSKKARASQDDDDVTARGRGETMSAFGTKLYGLSMTDGLLIKACINHGWDLVLYHDVEARQDADEDEDLPIKYAFSKRP